MKYVVLVLVVLLFFSPVVLNAQITDAFTDACAHGTIDAQIEVNKTMWLAVGCLLGFPIGWPLLPMVIEPSPPATKLLGMPPDHVSAYTFCYKDAGKKVQQNSAMKGCIFGLLIYGCCYLIYFFVLGAGLITT